MNEQEKLWTGEFGDQYLERNQVDLTKRLPFWREVAIQTGCESALEVGCSRGHNLLALRKVGVKTVIGIDINEAAVKEAREARLLILRGTPVLAPIFGPSFDLVFTAGLLIHIGPKDIRDVMQAIASSTRRYLLAIEYANDYEQEVLYRGHNDALWKRPYGDLYGALGFTLVDSGNLTVEDGFDNCKFWLMERA